MDHGEYTDWSGPEARSWQPRLQELLARGRVKEALRWLDRVCEDRQLLLFEPGFTIDVRRRLAWLYKINLLRGLGRFTEALAWACLECEMYPGNIAAHALKEQLKAQVLSGAKQTPDVRRSSEQNDRWTGVAGMRELKALLERDVILPLSQPELYAKYRVPLPNGVLLYGPPGCGKTHIARTLGRLLGFVFIEVRPSDLASIYVHGTQERIGHLFTKARKLAPCLLFIDELDAALPNRGQQAGHHYSAEVNEWLTQLDKASERRVLVIGATNRLDVIDPAALRPGRFDKKIFVGPPDLEARVELFRLYLRERPLGSIDFLAVAREAQGYTCAELELVVNEAARHALDRGRNIESEDLVRSMANNLPRHAEEQSREAE